MHPTPRPLLPLPSSVYCTMEYIQWNAHDGMHTMECTRWNAHGGMHTMECTCWKTRNRMHCVQRNAPVAFAEFVWSLHSGTRTTDDGIRTMEFVRWSPHDGIRTMDLVRCDPHNGIA